MKTQPILLRKALKEVYDLEVASTLNKAETMCERVFYMPELLDTMMGADRDSRIWEIAYKTPSIKVTGRTKQGKAVVAYVHKPNYFSNPNNIWDSMIIDGARVMPKKEFYKILADEGDNVIIVDHNAFKKYFNSLKNYDKNKTHAFFTKFALDHPQTIPFCGSKKRAENFLTHNSEVLRDGGVINICYCDDLPLAHPLDMPLARLLQIAPSAGGSGFDSDTSFEKHGAYFIGTPKINENCIFIGTPSDSENRERLVQPTLDQILNISSKYVPEIVQSSFEKDIEGLYKDRK